MTTRAPLPELTSAPPPDQRRFHYSYLGVRLFGGGRPLYVADSLRSQPTLTIGTTGSGKTELLVALAYQDMAKGRPVIVLDGKADQKTWDKLYFFARLFGRRFRALFPLEEWDRLSNSWSPLHSSRLGIHSLAESFFAAYTHLERGVARESSAQYYFNLQGGAFMSLMRALHESGWAVSINDAAAILANGRLLSALPRLLRPQGLAHFTQISAERAKDPKAWDDAVRGFVNHLALFGHWTLNSYSPEIRLEDVCESEGDVLYIALPLNMQSRTMSALGNVIVNQIRALSNLTQQREPRERTEVAVYIDEAGSFVDEALADWVSKVRSSGYRLWLGIQSLADLDRLDRKFGDRILANSPNLCVFNPNHPHTADLISRMGGHHQAISRSGSVEERPGAETGMAQERLVEVANVHADAINQLRTGQFYFRPAVRTPSPILLAGPCLPDPPDRPDFRWHGCHEPGQTQLRGLYAHQRMAQMLALAGLEDNPAPRRRPGARGRGRA